MSIKVIFIIKCVATQYFDKQLRIMEVNTLSTVTIEVLNLSTV